MDQCHVTVMAARIPKAWHPLFCTAAGFDYIY